MRCSSVLVACLGAALVGCQADVYDPFEGYIDRDGDGWFDVEEQDVGDPENPFDWDFGSGRWPDFTDEAMAGTANADFGYAMGQTLPDFLAEDQYGNPVPLYTFYGYAIVLDFGAGWCGPCRDSAMGAQASWEAHRLDGVLTIHQILDDDVDDLEDVVEEGFQRDWSREYGIEFPVFHQLNRDNGDVYLRLLENGVGNGWIPFFVVLDHEMRIVASFEGSDQVGAAEDLARDLARERDRSRRP